MKASALLLVGFWPIVLLLMLISGATAELDARAVVHRQEVHGQHLAARSEDNGYGVPPPYFTVNHISETSSDSDGHTVKHSASSPIQSKSGSVGSSVTSKFWNTTSLGTLTFDAGATGLSDDPSPGRKTSLSTEAAGNATNSQATPTSVSSVTVATSASFSSLEPTFGSNSSFGSTTNSMGLTSASFESTVPEETTITVTSTSLVNHTISEISSSPLSTLTSGVEAHSSAPTPTSDTSKAPTGNSTMSSGNATGPLNWSTLSLSSSSKPTAESTSQKAGLTVPVTIPTMPPSSNPSGWLTWPTSKLGQESSSSTLVLSSAFNNSAVTRTARLSVSVLSSAPGLPDPSIASSSLTSSVRGNFSWTWSETETKTLSPVLTSLLPRTSTGSSFVDQSTMPLTLSDVSVSSIKTSHWSSASTRSTASHQSTANYTSQSDRTLTVITVTGGTVVTISPGGFGHTPSATTGISSPTRPFNSSIEPTHSSSSNLTTVSGSIFSGFMPFTSDWSTITLENSATSDAISFTKNSSPLPGTTKASFPTNVTTFMSTRSHVNGTVSGANVTPPTSASVGNIPSTTRNETAWSTATDPVWSSMTLTTLSASSGYSTSIISVSISRATNVPQFPFPINSSLTWQTTASTAYAESQTVSYTSTGFLNSSMSGEGITMSTGSVTNVMSWPTPSASVTRGFNSTTGSYWTMNSTSGAHHSLSMTKAGSSPSSSIGPGSWSTVTFPLPPFPTLPSLNPTWTTIPESLTANLNISSSTSVASGTIAPPFPMPSNPTISPSIMGTGIPLPLPLPTFRSAITEVVSSAHAPSPSLSSGPGFSNSSIEALSTLNPTSTSGTVKPPFTTGNSSALTTSRGSGVGFPNGDNTTTTTIVITRSLTLTTTPSFSASTNTPWRSSSLSFPQSTGVAGGSSTTTLLTELSATQSRGVSASTLSIKTSSSIWANSTSGVSGVSGTADASGSVTPPASSTSIATTGRAVANSTLSVAFRLTSPLPPWVSLGSSTADGRSSSAQFPTRNSTISEPSSHVGAQTTSTDGVASTWIPLSNTTGACSYATNSTGSCTFTEAPSRSSTSAVDPGTTGEVADQSTTTNCTHTPSETASPQPLTPFIPIPITSTCNSSRKASTCTTFRWTNTPHAHASLTTLETVTRNHNKVSNGKPKLPVPAGATIAHHGVSEGGDSLVHRQPNVAQLGNLIRGDISPDRFVRRWEQVISKLKGLWRGDDHGDEGQYSRLE